MEPRLPCLPPLGIGTPECESLGSYFLRMAETLGYPPGQLVFRIFTWIDRGERNRVGQWCRTPGRVRIGHNISSFSHANVWLRILQRFTMRADLSALTTNAWDFCFPALGFQRRHLAWCPECLLSDKVPYHRLAWTLQCCGVCLKHRQHLCDRCPNCARPIPITHERSGIFRCPRCRGDLRRAIAPQSLHGVADFERWSSHEVGTIIADASSLRFSPKWNAAHCFRALANTYLSGEVTFARYTRTTKTTAWYWLTGRAQPSLKNALHVFFSFRMSLSGHLRSGALQPSEILVDNDIQSEMHPTLLRRQLERNWRQIQERLEQSLSIPQDSAPSLSEIGRDLCIAPRTLRSRFPALCRQIGRRNVSKRVQMRVRRLKTLRVRLVEALIFLRNKKYPPSQANVARVLRQPGLFSRSDARALLKSLIVGDQTRLPVKS
jgi:hypothetical protein